MFKSKYRGPLKNVLFKIVQSSYRFISLAQNKTTLGNFSSLLEILLCDDTSVTLQSMF